MQSVMEVLDGNGDKYNVIERIGSGGFGQVFKIQKQEDSSYWALKTLPIYTSNEELKGFKNEIQMALQINHENVINYLYVNEGDNQHDLPPYIIMPLANNGSLLDLIEEFRKAGTNLEGNELINMYLQLVDGMEAVNSKVVHRDIKPANILINDESLWISDFGLAKLVDSVTRNVAYTFKGYGTFEYVAPEGWLSDKNTIAMDIYAMGITFYQLATGEFPFNEASDNSLETWKIRHLTEIPIPLISKRKDLSVTLSQIIMKMIEKKVQNRYKNWDEIRQDLKKVSSANREKNAQVESLLKKRLDVNIAKRAKEVEETSKLNTKQQAIQMIYGQFLSEIVQPLKDFVDVFNEKSIDEKMIYKKPSVHSNEMTFNIRLVSNENLEVGMRVLFDEDFMREVGASYYRDRGYYSAPHKQVVRPNYAKREILAWGYIKVGSKGYNILLLENKEEVYGDFIFMINSESPLVQHRTHREAPIAFNYRELEENVPLIKALSRYQTNIMEYSDKTLTQFIVNNS